MLLAASVEHTVVDVSGVAWPTLLQLQVFLIRLAFLLLLSPWTLLSLYPSVTGIPMGVGAGVPAYSLVSAVAGVLAAASVPASTVVNAVCRDTFFLHTLHMELAGCWTTSTIIIFFLLSNVGLSEVGKSNMGSTN